MLSAQEANALAKRLNRAVGGTANDIFQYVGKLILQAAQANEMKTTVGVPDESVDWVCRQLRPLGYVVVPGPGAILVSWEHV